MSLANPHPAHTSPAQKMALAVAGVGIAIALVAWASGRAFYPAVTLPLSLVLVMIGTVWYTRASYAHESPGIKNNGIYFRDINYRGISAWILGVMLTFFYICLYWFPQWMKGLIELFNPLSQLLQGKPANQWFAYGAIYTIAVIVMGIKFGYKYRHNRYQLIRTASVTFFQLIFAFLIPAFLVFLNEPEFYFSYFWPLKKEYLFPNDLNYFMKQGNLGVFMAWWAIIIALVGVPILTYLYGKRWYCSWVCGCGGLAETAGDPFRHLSDKSLRAWKIERWLVHSVLIFIVITTLLLWANSIYKGAILGDAGKNWSKVYGFLIGSIFAGVVGTGFYPIFGARVWCRFGCPQAAILGIFQRFFSRFRITTNGGQCISCGNCSTYCEMGIDVRHYAQRGQNIVRASCVGCGICAAVCPRGVLKLENSSMGIFERTDKLRTVHIKESEVGILN
jgi:Pyruvate/2-oxoacid:ferredoxin oxidoreductase delta subunit